MTAGVLGAAVLGGTARVEPLLPGSFGVGSEHGGQRRAAAAGEAATSPVVSLTDRRGVSDPAQDRQRQLDEDRRAGLVAQARSLADTAPGSPMALSRLAQVLLGCADGAEARTHAEAALRLSAERAAAGERVDIPAVLMAARVLGEFDAHHDVEAALARLGAAESDDETLRVLYASVAAAQDNYELALLRLRGLDSAEVHLLRGYLLLQVRQPQEALRQLRRARLEVPDSPTLLGNIAFALAALGSPRKAVRAARQAWLLAPGAVEPALNLAYYLTQAGQAAEAVAHIREFDRMTGQAFHDRLTVSLVNALLAEGDRAGAVRTLQEAAARPRANFDALRRAEYLANIEYLRWLDGKTDRAALLDTIRQQLDACQQRSIGLACMLADVARTTDILAEVSAIYERLRAEHDEDDLLSLRLRLCALAGDSDGQLRAAEHWARVDPLDPEPAISVVYLRGTVDGDHQAAAKFGEDALRRFPTNSMLRNNTAFELVLNGQAAKAREVIALADREHPYVAATTGLVALALGDTAAGVAGYRRAISLATDGEVHQDDDWEFEQMVAVQLRLAAQELAALGCAVPQHVLAQFPLRGLPPAWRSHPVWVGLHRRAGRVGLAWPPS